MTTDKLTDPYAELGLPRDANQAEISAAYRKIAKATHPDGADAPDEATLARYLRANRAVVILRDPGRRRAFDETGRVEDEPIDHQRTAAATLLNQFIEQLVSQYVNGGFLDEEDPRFIDLTAEFQAVAAEGIRNAREQIAKGERAKRFMADMAKRWTGGKPGDVVHRAFELRLERIDSQIKTLKDAIDAREAAVELAREYQFRRDERPLDDDSDYIWPAVMPDGSFVVTPPTKRGKR